VFDTATPIAPSPAGGFSLTSTSTSPITFDLKLSTFNLTNLFLYFPTSSINSADLVIGFCSTAKITSPSFKPAVSAGLFLVTPIIFTTSVSLGTPKIE